MVARADELEDAAWRDPDEPDEDDPSADEVLWGVGDLSREEGGTPGVLEALDELSLTGVLPDDAPEVLREALRQADLRAPAPARLGGLPTLEVECQAGVVEARVLPGALDRVFTRKQQGGKEGGRPGGQFFQLRQMRLRLLTVLAVELLEGVQADFFRAADLATALRGLLPLKLDWLAELRVPEGANLGSKSLLSRLGRLIVATRLGDFPLSVFWPSLPAVCGVWVRAALSQRVGEDAGSPAARRHAIRDWILGGLENRPAGRESSLRARALELFRGITPADVQGRLKQLQKRED